MQTHSYCANATCPVHPEIVPEDSALTEDERQPCPVCGSRSRLYGTFPSSALGPSSGITGSITLGGTAAGAPPAAISGAIELGGGPSNRAIFQATSSLTLGGRVSPAIELIARSTLGAGKITSGTAQLKAVSSLTAEASVLPPAQPETETVRNDAAAIDAFLAALVAPEGSVLTDDQITLSRVASRVIGEIATDHEVTIRFGHLDEPGGAVVIAVLSQYKGLLKSGVALTPRQAILGILDAMLPGYAPASEGTAADDL